MKNIILLFVFIFFLIEGDCQQKDKMIDELLISRSNYLDSIPDRFKYFYPFIYYGDKPLYDTLKHILSGKDLSGDCTLFLVELIPEVKRNCKYGAFWSDSLIINFEWDRKEKQVGITYGQYPVEIQPFIKDIELWNEFVTNRSYYYSSIAGSSYAFCSRMSYSGGDTKIDHAVFTIYQKNYFFYHLKEQPDDDYTIRIKMNCEWIEQFNSRGFDVDSDFFEDYKARGIKVFDCNGEEF